MKNQKPVEPVIIKSVPQKDESLPQPARDYDYQDSESYEQPYRNSQLGYAPIDAESAEESNFGAEDDELI